MIVVSRTVYKQTLHAGTSASAMLGRSKASNGRLFMLLLQTTGLAQSMIKFLFLSEFGH